MNNYQPKEPKTIGKPPKGTNDDFMNKYQYEFEKIKEYTLNPKCARYTTASIYPVLRHYLEILQELVDKETPKKPIKKLYGHYKCPVCDHDWDSRDWKSKYCGLCGQRLDWSEFNGNCII